MAAFDPFHQAATSSLPLFNQDLYTNTDWKDKVNKVLDASTKRTSGEVKKLFGLIPSYYDERAKDRNFRRHEAKTQALMSIPNSDTCDISRESSLGRHSLAEINDWRSIVLMADALLYLHRPDVGKVASVDTGLRCYERRGIQDWSERAIDRLRNLYPLLVECKTVIERLAAENNQNENEFHSNAEIRALELLQKAKKAGSHEHAYSIVAKFSWVGVWYALCLSGAVPTRRNISKRIRELADKYEGYSDLRLKDEATPKTLATVNLWFQYCPFVACLRWAPESKPVSEADMNVLFRSLAPGMSPIIRSTRARFHQVAFKIATGTDALSAISEGINDCLHLLRDQADRTALAFWHTFGPEEAYPSSQILMDEEPRTTIDYLDNNMDRGERVDQENTRTDLDRSEAAGALRELGGGANNNEIGRKKRAIEDGCPDDSEAVSGQLNCEPVDSTASNSELRHQRLSGKGKRAVITTMPLQKKRRVNAAAASSDPTTKPHATPLAPTENNFMETIKSVMIPRALEGSRPGEWSWGAPTDESEEDIATSRYFDLHGVQLLPQLGKGNQPLVTDNTPLKLRTFRSDSSPVIVEYRPINEEHSRVFDYLRQSCEGGSFDHKHPLWETPTAKSQFYTLSLNEYETMGTSKLLQILQKQNIVVKSNSRLTRHFFHVEGFSTEALSHLGDIFTARRVEDQSMDPSTSLRFATLAEVYGISTDKTNEAVINVIDIPHIDGPFTFTAPPRYLDLAHDYAAFSKLNTPQLAGQWQWGTVCTSRTSSLPRLDAYGCYTYFAFGGSEGKVWFTFRPHRKTGRLDLSLNQPWLMDGQWESVYLMPGDLLIQKCNQIHADICGNGRAENGSMDQGLIGGSMMKTGCFLNLFGIKETVHGFLQRQFDGQSRISRMREQVVIQSLQRLIVWIEAEMKKHGNHSLATLNLLGFRLDTWTNVSGILALLNLHDSLVVINGKLSGVDEAEERDFAQVKASYRRTRAKAMSIRTMFEKSLTLHIDGAQQTKSGWEYIAQISLVHMLASLYVYQERIKDPAHKLRWKLLYCQTVSFLQMFKTSTPFAATIEEMYKVKITELKGRVDFDWTNWDTRKYEVSSSNESNAE